MPELPNVPINIDWFGLVGQFGTVMLYIALGAVAAAAGYFAFIFTQYKIKMTYWSLHGSGKDGIFAVGKPKKNKARWVKKRTAWRMLFPLFNKEDVRPFDAEYIYPGRRVYAYKLNDEMSPARHNIEAVKGALKDSKLYAKLPGEKEEYVEVEDVTPYLPVKIGGNLAEDYIRGSLDAVPYDLRNWYNSKLKENEMEFQAENWWANNRHMITVIGATLIVAVMVLVAVYIVYKMVLSGNAQVTQASKETISAFERIAQNIGGGGGGPPG